MIGSYCSLRPPSAGAKRACDGFSCLPTCFAPPLCLNMICHVGEKRGEKIKGEERRKEEGRYDKLWSAALCLCLLYLQCLHAISSLASLFELVRSCLALVAPSSDRRARARSARAMASLACRLVLPRRFLFKSFLIWKEERREDERRYVERVGEKRRSVLVGSFLSVLALLPVLARSLVSRFAFRAGTLPSLSRFPFYDSQV